MKTISNLSVINPTNSQEQYKEMKVVIISAEYYKNTNDENQANTGLLREILSMSGISYRQAIGCYKDCQENSFVCIARTKEELAELKSLAIEFNQESILVRDGKSVDLIFSNGDSEQIGTDLKLVAPKLAMKREAYTIMNGDCYVVI